MKVSRCTVCGYMGRTTFDSCPVCRSDRVTTTDSKNPKEEVVKLLCEALGATPPSSVGQTVKQAIDLVMG